MELGSQGIVLLDFFDESVHLLKWDSTSPILIGTMVIGGLIIIVCKSMIINYVAWYAPKGRPINAFTMIDQVRVHPLQITAQSLVLYKIADCSTDGMLGLHNLHNSSSGHPKTPGPDPPRIWLYHFLASHYRQQLVAVMRRPNHGLVSGSHHFPVAKTHQG